MKKLVCSLCGDSVDILQVESSVCAPCFWVYVMVKEKLEMKKVLL